MITLSKRQNILQEIRRNANQGDADEQYRLAVLLEDNDQDYSALSYYTMAACSGHVDAQFKLAQIYHKGGFIQKDFNKASSWYKKAAEQGHEEAKDGLEELNRPEEINKEVSKESVSELVKDVLAREKRASAKDSYEKALYHINEDFDIKEARKHMQLAADEGHEEAARELKHWKLL